MNPELIETPPSEPAWLVLADGSEFAGLSIGVAGQAVGEVVFNTAMTGYQEILTDPSYARQLVTLTNPHIGNTGINAEDEESRRIFCAGLIVNLPPRSAVHWRRLQTLPSYLNMHGTVAIAGIDTRRLTRLIRTGGAQSGCILTGEGADLGAARVAAQGFAGLSGMDLVQEVTASNPYAWQDRPRPGTWTAAVGYQPAAPREFHVVAYDFGIKFNILRLFSAFGCAVTVVPANTPPEAVLAHKPDGVFLSNGPGDPEPCDYAIKAVRELLARRIPMFGICLGHQLLVLAAGGKTEKMKFGHHGANHPVQNLATGQVFITSQNHGFAAAEEGLPSSLEITHRSLFDGTIQGVAHREAPAFSFQGHPEASPGPKDLNGMFEQFVERMREHRDAEAGAA